MAVIYYMLDNHTFMPLSEYFDEAIEQVREAWTKHPEQMAYGMVCSKVIGAPEHIHAREDMDELLDALPTYYATFPWHSCVVSANA